MTTPHPLVAHSIAVIRDNQSASALAPCSICRTGTLRNVPAFLPTQASIAARS